MYKEGSNAVFRTQSTSAIRAPATILSQQQPQQHHRHNTTHTTDVAKPSNNSTHSRIFPDQAHNTLVHSSQASRVKYSMSAHFMPIADLSDIHPVVRPTASREVSTSSIQSNSSKSSTRSACDRGTCLCEVCEQLGKTPLYFIDQQQQLTPTQSSNASSVT